MARPEDRFPSETVGTPRDTVVRNGEEARQGRRGLPVLIVLIVGVVLAFIALGGNDLIQRFAAGEAPTGAQTNPQIPSDGAQAPSNATPAPDNPAPAAPVQSQQTPPSSTGGAIPTAPSDNNGSAPGGTSAPADNSATTPPSGTAPSTAPSTAPATP